MATNQPTSAAVVDLARSTQKLIESLRAGDHEAAGAAVAQRGAALRTLEGQFAGNPVPAPLAGQLAQIHDVCEEARPKLTAIKDRLNEQLRMLRRARRVQASLAPYRALHGDALDVSL